MLRTKALVVAALAAASLFVGTLSLSGTPAAYAAVTDIASAGPLTHIFIGDNLTCQVAHTGDADYEMYDPEDQEGDCGTFLLIGGETYGDSDFAENDFSFVSQSGVTGDGSAGNPFTVITVVDAGTTGVRVTETDSYIVGNEFYRTDVQVSNTGNAPVTVRVYRGADCYLGGSDEGYGYVDTVGKVVACTENANNSPSGRVEMWTPITPADHYYQAYYGDVEDAVFDQIELPDSCICATLEDNGAIIDWNRTIGAGLNTTVSHYTTFSPTGIGAPTPTPGGPTSTPGSETATPVRIKTHTPTPSATPKATDTALPATDTPVASVTTAPPPPTEPGGGTQGNIHAPDTGSGPDGGSRDATAWMIIVLATAIGGAALIGVGRRVVTRR